MVVMIDRQVPSRFATMLDKLAHKQWLWSIDILQSYIVLSEHVQLTINIALFLLVILAAPTIVHVVDI